MSLAAWLMVSMLAPAANQAPSPALALLTPPAPVVSCMAESAITDDPTEQRSTAAAPESVEALVAAVAAAAAERIEFREYRHGELFDAPLITDGYLEYRADTDELVKQVMSPEPATLRVTEKAIFVERDGRVRRIALRKRPELAGMFAGLRGLLQGRSDRIEQWFTTRLESAPPGWRLVLLPRGERLARRLDRLVITGEGAQVAGICTQLDAAEWHFMDLAPERP